MTPQRVLLLTEEQGHGGVSTMLGLLQRHLVQQGWMVQTVNVRHSRPGLGQLLGLARQSQVLVASNNFLPAYWAVALGKLVHRPSVVWVHGPLAEVLRQHPTSWLKRQLLRWTCQAADLLVLASHTSQRSLHQAMNASALPVQAVIHNPAPPLCTVLPPQPPMDGRVALGFVGRLSAEKRPHLLLQMLTHLPGHHLTLVGDGPLRPALQAQAAALGLSGQNGRPPRVHFAGAQEVTTATYQGWQATVMCSAYEGYPMAALESLAAGVPCMGTPLPALQEMLGAQAGSWLAPQDTPQALADTLQRALQVPPAQRREQAWAIARQHSAEVFGQQWHAQLLRLTRQSPPGPKTVHFVHTGAAYMPELSAYETYLAHLGHHSQRHSDPATVPLDADIVWWICGRVSAQHSQRLRHSLQVHEYASASVGRWPALKDRIKRWRHPRPDHRVFLSEWVRKRMGFDDGVPSTLRDMGVPASFWDAKVTQAPDHDLVYLGEMGRLAECFGALQALSQAGLRLLLVGSVPPALRPRLAALPGITLAGRVPQADVAAWLLRARAGLNLMPERLPLVQQTSTKVLEYLAVGLPVLSNDYPWARQAAACCPERVRILPDTTAPQAWANAMQTLPPVLDDRSSWQALAWPRVLAALPLWSSLGLSPRGDA